MRRLILLAACTLAACDSNVYPAASPIAPTNTPAITVTNTNTNTNTATTDRSDTEATPTPSSPPASSSGVLPLPGYGEGVARDFAAAHPTLVLHSCQLTDGDGAWQFLDGLIGLLQARDARWGYLCKDPACTSLGRDVVTYKASTGDTGIWIVDVLGNHCPGPSDSPTMVRWGVLPFETVRRWIGHR